MNVYILRHGTTVWNEKGITQGRSQNRLSKNGKILANQTAIKLKNITFDVIFSSPLMRTMQTANIVNVFHKLNIIKTDLLTEVNQGIFTGRYKSSLTQQEQFLKDTRHPSTGIETYKQMLERCKEFVETKLKNHNYSNVLVVSHNNICSILECILTNTNPDFSNHAKMNAYKNAEFKKFTI